MENKKNKPNTCILSVKVDVEDLINSFILALKPVQWEHLVGKHDQGSSGAVEISQTYRSQ